MGTCRSASRLVCLVLALWVPAMCGAPRPGVELLYRVLRDPAGGCPLAEVSEVIKKRLDAWGCRGATVLPQGDEHILVRLPIKDPAALRQIQRVIENIGRLEFRLVADPSSQLYHEWVGSGREKDPPGYTTYVLRSPKKDGLPEEKLLISNRAEMTGAHIAAARVIKPSGSRLRPVIGLRFTPTGEHQFARVTAQNIAKRLAFVLNTRRDPKGDIIGKGTCHTAPVIRTRILGDAVIEGNFSIEEAKTLSIVLRAGSLPVPVVLERKANLGAAGELTASKDKDTIRILRGNQPVLEYRRTPNPFKPYVSKLYTPGGVQVLRDSPHDHVHHHALMFAITADGIDFWGESPRAKPGKQVPRGEAKAEGGVIEQTLDWLRPGEKPVLEEQRRIIVHAAEPKATLVTWITRLAPGKGRDQVRLSGAHYVGLGMRFVQSMDKVGTFLNPTGKPGEAVRGTEKLVRAPWCAYTAPADGKTVTIALFDHPDNPRHPPRMFTMKAHFAYLSATLFLHKESLAIPKGRALTLCYGVALWDGALGADKIEALYRRWCSMSDRPIAAFGRNQSRQSAGGSRQ